jgi:glycosyltransferase involved in cell wall biosynthesis
MNNNTKLIFVTTSDLTGTSGHNVATLQMVQAFARHAQTDLAVVCPEPKNGPIQTVPESRFYHFGPQYTHTVAEHVLAQIYLAPAMLRAVRTERPDAIVARHGVSMIVPPMIAQTTRLPYYLLARGRSHEYLKFNKILRLIFRLNVRLAKQVYVVDESLKIAVDSMRRESQAHAQIFMNAVDPGEMYAVPSVEAVDREKISMIESDFIVGYVGSMKEYHCVSELLEALTLLPSEVKAVLIGTGPEEDALRLKTTQLGLEERVYFTGFVPHGQVSSYMSTFDIGYGVIDPCHQANALKCYEYLACERPVITDRRAEFAFIESERAGLLIDDVNPVEIADAVRNLLDSSQRRRERMGRRGRRYVVEHHNWNHLPEIVLDQIPDNDENNGWV